MTQSNVASVDNILQYSAGTCISRLTILCMLGILSNRRLLQQLHSSPTIPGLGSREGRIHSKVRDDERIEHEHMSDRGAQLTSGLETVKDLERLRKSAAVRRLPRQIV